MSVESNLNPDETHRRVREKVAKLMKAAAFNCLRKVVDRNPVDSGYSRANWRIAINEPDRSVSTPPSSAERAANRNRKGWYSSGGGAMPSAEGATADDSIFVTNSVSYMRFLEEGSSKQAPAHFIKGVAQEVKQELSQYT